MQPRQQRGPIKRTDQIWKRDGTAQEPFRPHPIFGFVVRIERCAHVRLEEKKKSEAAVKVRIQAKQEDGSAKMCLAAIGSEQSCLEVGNSDLVGE